MIFYPVEKFTNKTRRRARKEPYKKRILFFSAKKWLVANLRDGDDDSHENSDSNVYLLKLMREKRRMKIVHDR